MLLWSDAAGTKGLVAFYVDNRPDNTEGVKPRRGKELPRKPQTNEVFSILLPRYLRKANEHINTKEIRAVQQALLYWGNR